MTDVRYFHDAEWGVFFAPDTLATAFVRHGDRLPAREESTLRDTPALSWPPPRLKRFRIEVNAGCNGACRYCLVQQNGLDAGTQQMAASTAMSLLRQFDEQVGSGSILILGGEPLLNWPVVEILADGSAKTVILFTNGTLVDDRRARFLAARRVKVIVSLDGPPPYDSGRRLRDGAPMLPATLDGWRRLQDAGVTLSVSCVVTSTNVEALSAIVAWLLSELGARSIGFSLPHWTGSATAEPEPTAYARSLAALLPVAREQGVTIPQLAQRLEPFVERRGRRHSCMAADEQWTFLPDGRRTVCSKLELLPRPVRVGDEFVLRAGSPLVAPACAPCAWRSMCGGGCFWDGLARYGGCIDRRECDILGHLGPAMLLDMARTWGRLGARWRDAYAPVLAR